MPFISNQMFYKNKLFLLFYYVISLLKLDSQNGIFETPIHFIFIATKQLV